MLARLAALVFSFLLISSPASIAVPQASSRGPHGQSAAPDPSTNPQPQVIRSTTRLVQISVIAQDGKGQPITGLKKEDFTVLDEGKTQKISVFTCASPAPAAPLPALPPHYFTNRFDLKGEDPGAVTVILFDTLNTASPDQTYVRQQVLRFLQTIKPQDHVAIYALTNNLIILHDFTQDIAALVDAVTRWAPKEIAAFDASNSQAIDFAGLSGDPQWQGFQDALNNAEGQIADQNTLNRVGTTTGALEAIANHVATLPGRKNLIWVSGGFPIQIGMSKLGNPQVQMQPATGSGGGGSPRTTAGNSQARPVGGGDPTNKLTDADRESGSLSPAVEEAAQALNRANMAIYPVDARGVILANGMSPTGRSAAVQPSLSSAGFFDRQDSHNSSRILADQTGGKAFYGNNDIRGAVSSAFDDARFACTIGFYPDHGRWDGKYREIRVKTTVSGAHLRYRQGYYASADRADSEDIVKTELHGAAVSPLETTSLGIIVNGKALQPRSSRNLQLQVALDPKQFLLKESDNHQKGGLDMLFVQSDAAGNIIAADKQHFEVNFEQKQFEYFCKVGIILQRTVGVLPDSGEIRVVVRDAGSGGLGSVNIPVKEFYPAETLPASK
jgi:VWFA-related protein